MAIQGIKGNILELLFSKDKKIQDFFSSVKPGDVLKGRIIEIFSQENKAIINFKGFNVISQVPEQFNLAKGETINVIVTQINDKIQMKILNSNINPANLVETAGTKIPNVNESLLSQTEKYINILKEINIPVNEQNLYIVQKLIDYGLPVNKENIFDVSEKLINYLEKKGIDIKALNVTGKEVANEIILNNISKFAKDIDALIERMNLIAEQNKGLQNINARDIKDITVRMINLLNVSKIISNKIKDADFIMVNNSLTYKIHINNKPENIQDMFNNLKNIKVNIETDGNSTKITLDNVFNIFKNTTDNFIKMFSFNEQIIRRLEQFFNNLRDISITQTVKKDDASKLLNIMNENGIKIFNELKNNFIALKHNINSANHTNIQSSIKEALNLTLTVNQVANEISKNFNLYKKDSVESNNNILFIKKELDTIVNSVRNLINKFDINRPEYKPVELLDIHSNLKSIVNNLSNLNILKENKPVELINQNNIINLVDVESTLEAIVFLKSRNLPTENINFIDLMQKYFQNGMKLNQNIEYFLISADKFKEIFSAGKNNQIINNSEINNLIDIAKDIKNIFNKIAISTEDNILNQNNVKSQIMNFIQSSGVNLETKIKDLLLKEIKINTADAITPKDAVILENKGKNNNLQMEKNYIKIQENTVSELRDNLKSQLIKLENQIDNIDINKYSAEHKEAINNLKKATSDLLTNINALQFINQKPLSFDMLYAQLPIFINNKFFNGEIQVWYRKGSLKQNMEATEPLNIVFLLNTSNLGNVKISIFIHKNDIECVIRTENEKAKQILNRNKEEFLNNIGEMNYKIKNFIIKVENDLDKQLEELSDGYINIGKIDLKA